MSGGREDQPGQKVPILEDNQKQEGLRDADETDDRALFVEPAENAFPDEDQNAKR